MDKILSTASQHPFPFHVIYEHSTCHEEHGQPGVQKSVLNHLPEHGQPYLCGLVIVKPGDQVPSHRTCQLCSPCADTYDPDHYLHQNGGRPPK